MAVWSNREFYTRWTLQKLPRTRHGLDRQFYGCDEFQVEEAARARPVSLRLLGCRLVGPRKSFHHIIRQNSSSSLGHVTHWFDGSYALYKVLFVDKLLDRSPSSCYPRWRYYSDDLAFGLCGTVNKTRLEQQTFLSSGLSICALNCTRSREQRISLSGTPSPLTYRTRFSFGGDCLWHMLLSGNTPMIPTRVLL